MTLAPALTSHGPREMTARSLTCPESTSTKNEIAEVEAFRSGVDVSVKAAAVESQTAMTVPALLAWVDDL